MTNTELPIIRPAIDWAGKEPPTDPLDIAISRLKSATYIAEKIRDGRSLPNRIGSVAWRTADALHMIAQYCCEHPTGDTVPGIDHYTGFGARLDAREPIKNEGAE